MIKTSVMAGAGLVVAALILGGGFIAGLPKASAETATVETPSGGKLDRIEVEGIVRDFLVNNPEILSEMQAALDVKRKEAERIASLKVIQDARAVIFDADYDGVVGNPKGKTTIVEFYDYNCGFCKRAQQDMIDLTASDPDLRFVLKEFPILGPDSQKAHVVSQAFHKLMPEKYSEFHNQLLGGHGRATEASAIKVAVGLGVDEAKLREEMKNPAIGDRFAQTYDLANKLSITGTPSYVVGNEVVFGALGKDVLSQKIASAKACADDAC